MYILVEKLFCFYTCHVLPPPPGEGWGCLVKLKHINLRFFQIIPLVVCVNMP